MKKLFLVSTLVVALGVSAFAAPYVLDKNASKVGFTIKHLKLNNVEGSFGKFDATIDYDSAKKVLNVLEGQIEVASVDTANKKRDDHLRANDIFYVEKFPKMTFKMTKYEAGKIYGDLTIKDKTKNIVLDAKESTKGSNLVIEATAQVKRSDFGVVWESSLKDSMVSDDLTIQLNLVATPK